MFKGSEIGRSGSIAWVLSNYFAQIPSTSIDNVVTNGSNVIKLEFRDFNSGVALTNQEIGVTDSSQIRFKNYPDASFNGLSWQVYEPPGDPFSSSNNYVHFQIIDQQPQGIEPWEEILVDNNGTALDPVPTVEFSNSNFKEVGVLGAEALRTSTEIIGNYKLGINTVARLPHSAYTNAWVGNESDPRANLDVVGTAFISGRTTGDFLFHTNFADRDKTAVDNAFLVGGDSAAPNDISVFRIATTNSGRVGINVSNANLDRALVVDGTSRYTDDAKFEHDIEVNGDDGVIAEIRTSQTTGTFNLITDNTFTGTINFGNKVETINIGNTTEEDQFINIGKASLHSNIDLGVTPDNRPSDGALTISKVQIGGAYDSTESLSFTRVKSKSFKVDGDFVLGGRRTITDSVRLSTTAGTVSFFSDSGSASTINFATNASEINIAGQGGTTTINNQLRVIASARFDGNITLCGGVASFSFVGDRAQLGSTVFAHDDGILSDTLFNKNIDILNVLVIGTTAEGYNEVDTAGSGDWGGAVYQQEISNIGGNPVVEPQTLPSLVGTDLYYLPLLNAPNKANGDPYFVENDYIIINSAVSASGHPEIVQVVELTRTLVAPYYVKVKRQPLGTYTAVLDNHPDRTVIYKVNVQFDATWTEQALDNTGPQDNVYLSEFGGTLTDNDYVIIDREDTNGDGIFNQGEVIKVVTPLSAEEQKFTISKDCSDPANDVFVVNSVTGDTTILGNTTINNSLKIAGGCGTISTIEFTGDVTAGIKAITNVVVTSPGKTINDLVVGDYVANTTNESQIEFTHDTFILAIDTVNSTIYLNEFTLGASTSNITMEARRNEKFLLTNGNSVPVYQTDTCTGTTTVGNHFGRIDIEYSLGGDDVVYTNTAALPNAFDAGIITKAFSYWVDPKIASEGGPDTNVRATALGGGGLVQVPVNSLGEGDGKFAVNNLVFIGTVTAATTGVGDFIIGKITEVIDDATNPTIVVGAPGDGLDTNQPFTPSDNVFDQGNVVRRVIKHQEYANIIDIETRTRVISGSSSTYCSMILDRGYIVQSKLDYLGWVALANDRNQAQMFVKVAGRLEGIVHTPSMNEQKTLGGIPYRRGDLNVSGDLKLIGGGFQIMDSVNQTPLLTFINDDGHADHQGLFRWDAGVIARGDFYLFKGGDPENVVFTPDTNTPSFSVDNSGNVTAEKSLTIEGVAATTPSSSFKQFSVQNLGPSGTEEFSIKQDSSIDGFGYQNYITSSGAKHTRYISSASTEADLILKPNIVYMVNTTASSTLVLTMPSAPQTGDVIRITDVGGNLSYNTSLVLRTPETSGTKIQGDSTGTLLGGRITPYPSGELVVQTPNAAFALVYLGATDNNGQVGIPTSVQGWWLTEV